MIVEALPRPLGFVERFIPDRFQSKTKPPFSGSGEVPAAQPQFTIENGSVDVKTITLLGRDFQGYNITPDTTIEPQGRIFLANGWRSSVVMNRTYITHLVQAGFTVTSFDNNFTRGDAVNMTAADKTLKTGKHPAIEFVKASAIDATLKSFPSADPDEKIGFVAHSEGTIYSAIAALDRMDRCDFLIQINSAGHAKPTSLLGLITRGSIESMNTKRQELPMQSYESKINPLDVIIYVAQNFRVAIPELKAIAGTKTKRLVAYVKEGGIPIGAINGNRDKIFPSQDFKQHIREGLFDYVAEVDNGAHEISTNPEEYAWKTLVTIAELRAKKARQLPRQEIVFAA